jgi:hypothetical protein
MGAQRDYEPAVWGDRGFKKLFGLDPRKPQAPQIFWIVVQFATIFGGPLIALITIDHYPFLILDRTLYFGGLASIGIWFLASFVFFGDESFPKGTPRPIQLMFRAGWGLCMTGWVLGVSGIANGYATPLIVRDAAVVAKHPTLERDPARRIYYVAVRAWPDASLVVELPAPRAVYDGVAAPVVSVDTPNAALEAMPDAGRVRLVVGQGRLGLEWLKAVLP